MPAARSASSAHSADSALRKRLAPLRERGGDDAREQRVVVRSRARSRAAGSRRATAESTFGAGRNAPGGTTNRRSTRNAACSITRQPAVVGRAGRCRHAVDHFPLQHDVHVAQLRVVRREVEQQRRADVVRQVADDAQVAAERGEVELERVGLVQRQSCRRRERSREPGREVAVDLDGGDVAGARDQACRSARRGPDRSRRCCRPRAGRPRRRCARRNAGRRGSSGRSACAAVTVHRVTSPRCVATRERDRELDRRDEAAGVGGLRPRGVDREVERGAVIDRRANERQAERHVDAARRSSPPSAPAGPGRGTSRRSRRSAARCRGTNTVSAGSGPVDVDARRARMRRSPARSISISSRPRWPPSPACGLSPQTAMRGAAMPKLRRAARVARWRASRRTASQRDRGRHVGERQVRRYERDAQRRIARAADQHHHDARRVRALGEELGVAGERNAGVHGSRSSAPARSPARRMRPVAHASVASRSMSRTRVRVGRIGVAGHRPATASGWCQTSTDRLGRRDRAGCVVARSAAKRRCALRAPSSSVAIADEDETRSERVAAHAAPRASRSSSGPMPAGSPLVIAMRGRFDIAALHGVRPAARRRRTRPARRRATLIDVRRPRRRRSMRACA